MGKIADEDIAFLREGFFGGDGRSPEELMEALWLERQQRATRWAQVRADPVTAFADRANWPPALDYEQAQDTTERWAASKSFGLGIGWTGMYPLPVGTESILAEPDLALVGQQATRAGMAPLPGHAWAAWALTAVIAGARVECFGLVDRHIDAADPEGRFPLFSLGECGFCVASVGPPAADVPAFCHNVSDWWKQRGGTLLAPGRPPGTGYWHYADVLEQLRDFVASHGKRVRRDAFLEHIEMPIPTWKDKKKEWGKDWREMVAEAISTQVGEN